MLPGRTARVPRIVLSCLLGAFFMAWVSLEAEIVGQPFALTISVENPTSQTGPDIYTVKSGSEVFIKVHLTNISRHKLFLGYDADSRTGVSFGHLYEVRNNTGNLAQKRTINHPEIGSTSHGWPARILKPGESMDITGDHISRLYDLSQLDSYTIQLSRTISDNSKDGVVKSNTITVMVTR
jgi:hypothetical protein